MSAVFAFMLAFPLTVAAQDDDAANGETAEELLVDGMDAAADHADESARRLFNKLIAVFPTSPEASRARSALLSLDSDDGDRAAVRAAIQAEAAERTLEYRHAFLITVGDRVFFAENSATLGGRARSIIKNQARWLKVRPALTVTVIGRADDGGDRTTARMLSQQRSEAVRDQLIEAGLDPLRIEIRPVGTDDRLAICASALCRAENRNAEVFINDLRDLQPVRTSAKDSLARRANAAMRDGSEGSVSEQVQQ
ncbi:MAG TPA: OmpA family protein [Hyphomicrobium sp.]|nr:OmpA family protein [Hyphomicrobium sp.]